MTRVKLPRRVGWAKTRSCTPCPPRLGNGGHAEPVIGPAQRVRPPGGPMAGSGRTRWLCPPCVAAAASVFAATAAFAQAPAPPTDAEILTLMKAHCVACHAAEPTHEAFAKAPAGVLLETVPQVAANAARIMTQVAVDRAMPLGNATGMTDEERDRIAAWIEGRNK